MVAPVVIAALVATVVAMPLTSPGLRNTPHASSAPQGSTGASYGNTARLRPQGARATRWLQRAIERSPTVQRLVARIEASDVIVYLDVRPNLGPNLAACLTWMAATSTRRIVRTTLRTDLNPVEAAAMIAHELQHVVEVIEHPEVRSSESLLALYERIGHPTADTGLHWDTADAIAQGTLARLEVRNGLRPDRGDGKKGT